MLRTTLLIVIAAGCMASVSGAARQVEVIDPALNMKAFTWTIPANWIFEGAVLNGTSCMETPDPIFRAMSPDGIVQMKRLPRFDWTWQTGGPQFKAQSSGDCLPFNRMMPASEFLKYMVGLLSVTFVREETAPGLAEYRERLKTMSGLLKLSGDMARFRVRYNINSIAVEESLSATIRCSENTRRFGVNQVLMSLYACSAWVTRERARQGQLESMDGTFKAIQKSIVMDPQWNQRRIEMAQAQLVDQQRRGMEAIKRQGQAIAAASQARHEAFMESQAMRQRQHEQFLATMQRGTDMSMRRTGEAMNARSRMAGDWADYALDQQKRRDPRTGEITKDSSAYSYTWIDESGKRIQTNDVNDNPNGRLNGNWTLQQNVR